MAAKLNVTTKTRKSSPARTSKGKKMETTQVNGNTTDKVIPSAVTVVNLPLTEIVANGGWNVRSGDFTKIQKGPDGEDWDAFTKTIEVDGQDTPVTVRKHPKLAGKYELAAGFRRFAAITAIAARGGSVPNIPGFTPTAPRIRAEVKALSDTDMRFVNLRENTARENLKAADLGYGFHELGKLNKTGTEIAFEFGLSQPYVARLKKIWDMMPKVAEVWRAANNPLPVSVMQKLGDEAISQGEKLTKYNALVAARPGRTGGGRAADAWVKSATNAAAEVGRIIGALDHAGLVTASTGHRLKFTEEHLRAVVKMKSAEDGCTPEHAQEIVAAAQAAYKEAVKGPKDSN